MILSLIPPAYAYTPYTPASQGPGAAPLCLIESLVKNVFDAIWPFIGIAILAMFIYGGVMWMFSTGDPGRIGKAVSTMLWAFIGAVLLVMVMVLLGVFERVFGITSGFFSAGSIEIFSGGCP